VSESVANCGLRFRAQRERRGLTLEDVAASTKISTSLLRALERDDLTRWPKGIYGRAFLRAYADAIGWSADSLVDDVLHHVRTFQDVTAAGDADSTDMARSPMRLTLGAEVGTRRHIATHTLDAAVTLAAVFCIAALIGTAMDVSILGAAAGVALVWYPIAHALFGGFSPVGLLTKARRVSTTYVPHEPGADHQAFADYQVTH